MAHSRETIRKAIVTAITGLTTTGTNVEVWRTHAIEADEHPHLAVMPGSEAEIVSESIENTYGVTEHRDLPIIIEARAVRAAPGGTHTTLADTIDDICAEVEIAMTADTTLGGLAVDTMLLSTELSLDGSGERPVGLAVMGWLVRYAVNRTNPTG